MSFTALHCNWLSSLNCFRSTKTINYHPALSRRRFSNNYNRNFADSIDGDPQIEKAGSDGQPIFLEVEGQLKFLSHYDIRSTLRDNGIPMNKVYGTVKCSNHSVQFVICSSIKKDFKRLILETLKGKFIQPSTFLRPDLMSDLRNITDRDKLKREYYNLCVKGHQKRWALAYENAIGSLGETERTKIIKKVHDFELPELKAIAESERSKANGPD